MNDEAIHQPTQSWLLKPTYGYVGPMPNRPTTREVLVEWGDAIAFWKDRNRLVPALCAVYHVATFGVFGFFVVSHFSILAVASVILIATSIGTTYNTVWCHRYSSGVQVPESRFRADLPLDGCDQFRRGGHLSCLGTNGYGVPVNQVFYGVLGANGMRIIRLMKLCRIVAQYNSLASVRTGAAQHAEAQPLE